MIMLKESSIDQAAMTMKGINMAPENYEWMVKTIKKRYDNAITTRANIIERLSNLQPARKHSNDTVLKNFCPR